MSSNTLVCAVVLLALMALPFLDSCPLLLRYFYMFYLGMLCANLRTASVPAWWPRLAFKVIVPVAIMGWVLAGSRYLPHENALMLQTLCSALIICAITLTAASRHTWLDAKPLRMLGRVSYSFYLMHFLCLYVLTRLLLTRIPELQNHPLAALGSLIILSVGVAAILAWILYRVVEAPMIRLGKRLTHPSSNNKASSACG